VVTLALKKNSKSRIGLKVKPQSAFNAFRDLLPSATILLSDLVGCDSPLQILMAVWRTYFQFEVCQTSITICSGMSRPTQQIQIIKKVRQTAICICRGLSQLTGWAVLPSENISQCLCQGNPSEDVNSHLFFMNYKGLTENMDKGYYLP
jgi:hypothetical protein